MAEPIYLYVSCVIVGYFVGSFPTGVVLTRRKYGIDVREMGSGNIGATNVTRVFGWYAGVVVFAVDFLKGFVPLALLRYQYSGYPWLLTLTAMALVLGHCFSLYLGLRGGKGVATSLGCLLIVSPWMAGISAATYALLLLVSRISAVGSLGGIGAALLYALIVKPPIYECWLVAGISLIVLVRHHSNIRRLWSGSRFKTSAKGNR